jgi:hypothetical protein
MKTVAVLTLAVATSVAATRVSVADVSATDFLNEALSHQPPIVVNRTEPVNKTVCVPDLQNLSHGPFRCETQTVMVPSQATVLATVATSRVVKATNVLVGRPTMTSVPIDSNGSNVVRRLFDNCSSKATLTSKIVFSAQGTEGWKLDKTQGVQATQNTSVGLQIPLAGLVALFVKALPQDVTHEPIKFLPAVLLANNLPLQGYRFVRVDDKSTPGGTISFGQSWSQQVSTSTTTENSYSKVSTNTDEEDVSIPPSSAVSYEYIVYQATGTVPFTADVVVDGDVIANASGVSLASQLLPDEQTRTLRFAGNLVLQSMSSGAVHTADTGGCSGGSATIRASTKPVQSEAILQTSQCASSGHKIGFGVFNMKADEKKKGNFTADKFLRCLSQ